MPFSQAPALPSFLQEMMPFSRRMYTLEDGPDKGRTLHFVDHGNPEGRHVLLVHGNPTWSFLWRKVIAALPEERFRCIAPDLLGLGLSDKTLGVQDHSLKRHIDAIAALVDALECDDLILVGQDWGGPVAVGVGALMPERIRGIVLGNTAVLAPKRPRGTAFHRFSHMPIISDFVFRFLGLPHKTLHVVQGDKRSIRGKVAKAYKWPLRSLSSRAAPLALARMVPNHTEHPTMEPLRFGQSWIESFQGPITLVWGERDPILGKALKRHQKALPHAKTVATQAGHFLQEEVPELLAQAIQDIDILIQTNAS